MIMLTEKIAVIYGGAGPVGAAMARGFARNGARVHLAGRTEQTLRAVADSIPDGAATPHVVDALDREAVDGFVGRVLAAEGRIDISANVIGVGDVQRPLLEIDPDEFVHPIATMARTQFLTTRAVAPAMIEQGGGVILAFGGSGPQTVPGLGGFKIALDTLEGIRRQWAVELGPHGIRVITLKSGGIGEALPDSMPAADRRQLLDSLTAPTLLGRLATLADVGNVASFAASDLAASITSTELNISCGATPT
ncbi:SDR family NAD(P)-dependent oxidoreductase [Microlunatus parietis]|uniref:NAD(P)-dependent dehydrogenase (Short-subunit alcohol dehydrogenase family) n=1 Tax=Microlunatus parietis TaxID=682979 RepID=A0A7Y9ICK8_9ACTN|nr:SDR family oxidoreductase [Microlunatus parietis]NYE73804.1 NAD(P)-dependent dehydrogenase (short-subunit alcohol dehydrogenase family) [Microlunatus parietis]